MVENLYCLSFVMILLQRKLANSMSNFSSCCAKQRKSLLFLLQLITHPPLADPLRLGEASLEEEDRGTFLCKELLDKNLDTADILRVHQRLDESRKSRETSTSRFCISRKC